MVYFMQDNQDESLEGLLEQADSYDDIIRILGHRHDCERLGDNDIM